MLFVVPAFAASKPVIVHESCVVAVDPTYNDNGLNVFLTQMVRNVLTKKGYAEVISIDEVTADTSAMGLAIDLTASTKGDSKNQGTCEAIVTQRGVAQETREESPMQLATIIKKKGKLHKVASKCIKEIQALLKKFPECVTSVKPVPAEEPTPTPEEPTDPIEGDPVVTDPIEGDPVVTDPVETDPITEAELKAFL